MSRGVPSAPRKWVVFAAVGGSYFITVAAMTFSLLALTAIAEDFEVTLRTVGWVVIVESLIVAALLLPLGRLSDVVGRHRALRVGIAVFGLGLLLAGLAPTFPMLILARVVTALGNTLVQAVGTGILVGTFPPEERGLALGGQTTAVAFGAALGPLLGGLLLDVLDWRLLFFALAVPTALVFVVVHLVLGSEPHTGTAPRHNFDLVGAALAASFMVVLVLTLNDPFEFGWSSPMTVTGAFVAAVLLIAFVRTELTHRAPMLDVRLFQIGEFRRAALIRLVGFSASSIVTFLVPVYLLGVRGLATRTTGALVALFAIGMMLSAQASGRLYDRLGPRVPMLVGLCIQGSALLLLATVETNSPVVLVALGTLGNGLGLGLWNVPANSVMMGAMPHAALGVGGAFTNLTRTVGSAVGQAGATAIVATVMASRGADIPLGELGDTAGADGAFISGWQATYIVATMITGLGLAIAARTGSRVRTDNT